LQKAIKSIKLLIVSILDDSICLIELSAMYHGHEN